MTYSSILELAKQGDPQAIATLIAQSMQSQDISVDVHQKDGCVYVWLSSTNPPAQKRSLDLVRQTIEELGTYAFSLLKVAGYKQHKPFSSWVEQIELGECITEFDKSEESNQESITPSNDTQDADGVSSLSTTTDRFIICGLGSLGQYQGKRIKKEGE